jgi:hypothetical protein
MFIMLGLGAYMLIRALGHIGTAITVIAAVWFSIWKFFRVPRKRIRFLLRLRKKCKNLGYQEVFYFKISEMFYSFILYLFVLRSYQRTKQNYCANSASFCPLSTVH